MIIQCQKCGTKFRFDDDMIGEGIWARCSRCQAVFFQKGVASPDDSQESQEQQPVEDGAASSFLEGIEEEKLGQATAPQYVDSSDPSEHAGNSAMQDEAPQDYGLFEKRRRSMDLWTPGKITAYVAVLIVVLSGVYLSVFPQVGQHILGQMASWIPYAQYVGLDKAVGEPNGGAVDLLDVRERFLDNRMVGSLMIIQGLASNKNSHPVSAIKVRAKLLDATGDFVGESEAYCGNILSEEELLNLTEKEIRAELNNPLGKSAPNSHIAPGASIPFMVVFTNSPKKAVEFIVELAELEKLSK